MPTKYTVKEGDTLNSISQKLGYKDYKDGGVTSVPSGDFDLIRPGEIIDFNGSTNNVGGFEQTTPLVTSKDSEQQFKKDGQDLDSIMNPSLLEDDGEDVELGFEEEGSGDFKTGDEDFDAYTKSANTAKLKSENEAKEVLLEYDSLYKTELANIDARTRASTREIKRSFVQRINEQKRINKVNVDRVKAYGLSNGAAQYTPLMWSDAITERERKGAEEISGLERERQDLIDAAKAAQSEGNAALLSQKIKDYNSVKDKLNKRLDEIQKDSEAQYKLLRELREEQEQDFQDKKDEALKRLQAYYKLNPDEIENLSPEEKESLVNAISTKYGFENYEILGVVESAGLPDYEALQAEADIARTESLSGASDASAAASYARAAKTKKETELLDEEDASTDGNYSTSESNKLRQAGLEGAPVEVSDAFLYADEFDEEAQALLEEYKQYLAETGQ